VGEPNLTRIAQYVVVAEEHSRRYSADNDGGRLIHHTGGLVELEALLGHLRIGVWRDVYFEPFVRIGILNEKCMHRRALESESVPSQADTKVKTKLLIREWNKIRRRRR